MAIAADVGSFQEMLEERIEGGKELRELARALLNLLPDSRRRALMEVAEAPRKYIEHFESLHAKEQIWHDVNVRTLDDWNPKFAKLYTDRTDLRNTQGNVEVQIDYVRRRVMAGITTLRSIIEQIQVSPMKGDNEGSDRAQLVRPQVLLGHGHNTDKLNEVFRFLVSWGVDPVVVVDRPRNGTLINKFKKKAEPCTYAVMLWTSDDVGRAQTEDEEKPRARQNVILETGWLLRHLGEGQVAMLHGKDVEIPSNLDGVEYISLDGDNWQAKLLQDMMSAGLDISPPNA